MIFVFACRGKLRKTEYDGIFLGLYLDDNSKSHLLQSSFDGFFTYFAATGFTQGSTPSNWKDIMQWVRWSSILLINAGQLQWCIYTPWSFAHKKSNPRRKLKAFDRRSDRQHEHKINECSFVWPTLPWKKSEGFHVHPVCVDQTVECRTKRKNPIFGEKYRTKLDTFAFLNVKCNVKCMTLDDHFQLECALEEGSALDSDVLDKPWLSRKIAHVVR